MKNSTVIFAAGLAAAVGASALSCSSPSKIDRIKAGEYQANISMSGNYESDLPELHVDKEKRDTIQVTDFDGQKKIIMKAVAEKDGGLVATEELNAAVVTARFRNIPERFGKVDLRFDVHVPKQMQDSRWQLRFYPDMYILGDSVRLDPVIITGAEYRKAQLRGYQQYKKFIDSIVTDSTKFINLRALELYISRYFETIYALKTDTTFVSDEAWRSMYGKTEQEAIEHYTDQFRVKRNEKKKANKGKMFKKYVKAPIVTEGLRLDTVIVNSDGDFVYEYVQTIETRKNLKKVDIVLSGDIYEQDRVLYRVPRTEPLTFYISSLASFLDPTVRYKTMVVERRAEANSVCWIGFRQGRDDIDPDLGDNASEIARIKDNLGHLVSNDVFDLDSVAVTASTSPEGSVAMNARLSLGRARSVTDYFGAWMRRYRDSLRREEGLSIVVSDDLAEGAMTGPSRSSGDIRLISHSGGENWDMLTGLVAADTVLAESEKESYTGMLSIADPDAREAAMQSLPGYRHLREDVYPALRTVRFNFYLHRKGMVKDTVHTTVVDSAYMDGVAAIRDRDFETAVTFLRPYRDYNSAVAYLAMGYDASAMDILKDLPRTDQVEYMLAILYSRMNDDQQAVQHYMNAVNMNRNFIFRGNLDPEISVLIKKYGLNQDDDDYAQNN